MTLFGDMIGWLIGSVVDLGREIAAEVWRHPQPYAVTAALLPALALWGVFCVRLAPEEL
jgi:hypothetical protein